MHGLTTKLVALAAVALAGQAARADFVYPDFSSVAGLKLNGDTRQAGTALQLTNASGFSSGSVFTSSPVALGNLNTFSTTFQFQILNSGGISDEDGSGADGLMFVVQTVSNSVGGAGGGIGYAGIRPSLGVEFDTYNNGTGAGDPNGNHVGVDVNGSLASVVTALEPTRFNNGQVWNAWIDYDGVARSLEVRWGLDPNRPALAQLRASVDLNQILGQNTAFVGFTSATGSAWGNHDILNWSYRQTLSAVPEPSSAVLTGLGAAAAVGLLALRRNRRKPA